MTIAWRLVALLYVLVDAGLGAAAFAEDQARAPVEIAAFLLLLPTLLVSIPVIYVVGAMAWHVRDQMSGHPMWPVTGVFTGLFVAAATVNVVFFWLVASSYKRQHVAVSHHSSAAT